MNKYKLIDDRFINEIEARGKLYIHQKSGARVFIIENNDDNKVFSISFKTPPIDNTGLTHILEHSVLSGSKNFPTKEPFVDLAKGSLNTFLNALTFSDKTMYPVASKNEKDFYNLMEVYLDAVFYPNIYEHKEIFEQEGWHYDINNTEDDIVYKGVVYNEMLGAFSSAEEILFTKVMEVLYPDSCYGFESGGDPDFIQELSYETFLDYHRDYYCPSNCYIYLYGNGNMNEILKFIDDKYLKFFDKGQEAHLTVQKPFSNRKSEILFYPVASEEDEYDETYLSLNYVVGSAIDAQDTIGLDILEYILMETPASPLKKALIDSNLGRDVMGNYDQGLLQPMFNIVLKESNLSEKYKFIKLVDKTLKDIVNKGIDKKLIEASINSLEFKLREANGDDTPKGLLYGMRCMDSWLYNEDPFIHLEYAKAMSAIKEKAYSGYFEQLIQKYLIDNTHSAFVALVPQKKLYDERIASKVKKLRDYKTSLTKEQLTELIDNNKKLQERQVTPDSDEMLSKIPMLSLEDINKEVKFVHMSEESFCETKILHHTVNTNGIIYTEFLFDTCAIAEEELFYLALLSDLMGMLSTKNYSHGELSNEIDIHTGGIGFDVDAYEEVDTNNISPVFVVQAKVFVTETEKLLEITEDIINNTRYYNKVRILEILREIKSDMEMDFIDDANGLAAKRLCSYFSKYNLYMERLSGISYYNFIVNLEENYDSLYRKTVYKLINVSKKIFTRGNLTCSIVCNNQAYEQFLRVYPQFVDKLVRKVWKKVIYKLKPVDKNEGIINNGNVQHIAAGYNYKVLGYEYSGYMQVLNNILSLDYFWKRIRLNGGAYGVFSRFEMGGNAYFVSYNDPELSKTLEVFRQTYKYLETFDISEREMHKYIIGAISGLDQPLTPEQIGQRNVELHYRHISKEMLINERKDILSADVSKIRSFSALIKELMDNGFFCVVGSEQAVEENKRIFNRVYNVYDDLKVQD